MRHPMLQFLKILLDSSEVRLKRSFVSYLCSFMFSILYMYILHLYFTKGTTRLNTCCSIEEVLASPRRHLHRVPQPRHGHLDKNVNIFILSYFCQGHLYNDVIICIAGALIVVIYGVSIHSIHSTLLFLLRSP